MQSLGVLSTPSSPSLSVIPSLKNTEAKILLPLKVIVAFFFFFMRIFPFYLLSGRGRFCGMKVLWDDCNSETNPVVFVVF